jgi:hypothetical protein
VILLTIHSVSAEFAKPNSGTPLAANENSPELNIIALKPTISTARAEAES